MLSVIANWKMYLSLNESCDFLKSFFSQDLPLSKIELLIAPSFPIISIVKKHIGSQSCGLVAQNLCSEASGPFTGEVSGKMLSELGCSHVLVGHSERRILYCESDEIIRKKVNMALQYDLKPIVCVGESYEDYQKKRTSKTLAKQLKAISKLQSLWVAYEPVWAIGSGLVPSIDEIELAANNIKSICNADKVFYGGSVSLKNIDVLCQANGIDGYLVGGVSTKIDDFSQLLFKLSTL